MVNYAKLEGKLIKLNNTFPIYDREDDNKVIGYTQVDDLAVITYIDKEDKHGYFETIIVSGRYIGIDTLALNNKDIENAIFVFNKIDGDDTVYICDRKVKFERR